MPDIKFLCILLKDSKGVHNDSIRKSNQEHETKLENSSTKFGIGQVLDIKQIKSN
jgi:hypothetical protein